MNFPEMIRNVAVLGHLHHGKTALLDMLVFETHSMVWDADRPVSFSLPSFACKSGLIEYLDSLHRHTHSVKSTRYIHQIITSLSRSAEFPWEVTPCTSHRHPWPRQLHRRSGCGCSTSRRRHHSRGRSGRRYGEHGGGHQARNARRSRSYSCIKQDR
jgi:hypothetical protein